MKRKCRSVVAFLSPVLVPRSAEGRIDGYSLGSSTALPGAVFLF